MKVAFDTSVFVAALIEAHEHHAVAFPFLERASRSELHAVAGLHAYAETFRVLTAIRDPRISGGMACTLLDAIRGVRWVAPTQTIYLQAASRCAKNELSSGAIYDALHLMTAEHEQVDHVVTFNVRDFERLRTGGSPTIIRPGIYYHT